ncbi:WXG100 family type VII secretion target [Actinomadura sp. 9N407]|uniref:WXG100 family type VII secretion target n=1 Tax=Actinomadura sp. 9N407 TaxID=3375154 RepID=UPI003791BC43
MTVLNFPAAAFEVEGEPETIRESARKYGRFSTAAGQASSDIRNLSSGEWIGSEGDLFRTGVAQLPPHYDTAHTAFGQVSQALTGFANELDSLKSRMGTLRSDAQQTFGSLKSAENAKSNLKEPTEAQTKDDPTAKTAYDQQKAQLDGRLSGLEGNWQQHLTQAAALRNQANEAATRAGQAIRAAGRTSPTSDQNWLERGLEKTGNWIGDRIQDIKGFIKEHADVFRFIATALKWVGGAIMAIAAVAMIAAAFIPVLGWLAELPLGGIFAAGAILFGAGDFLGNTVDWAEGKISGKELFTQGLIGAALSLVGAGIGRLLAPLLKRLGPQLRKWVDDLFGKGKKSTPNSEKPPGMDGNPLKGGTPDNPRKYSWKNPAEQFRNEPQPDPKDLRGIKNHKNYEPGTREHMLARWKEYLKSHPTNAKSWDFWRDNYYIDNLGRKPKGDAYENAFYGDHGFKDTDGWVTNTDLKELTGVKRNYDIVNPEERLAYELKSGNSLDPKKDASGLTQLDKDKQLAAKGWKIVYIFGEPPSAADIKKLNEAGIPYQVWHGQGSPVP